MRGYPALLPLESHCGIVKLRTTLTDLRRRSMVRSTLQTTRHEQKGRSEDRPSWTEPDGSDV